MTWDEAIWSGPDPVSDPAYTINVKPSKKFRFTCKWQVCESNFVQTVPILSHSLTVRCFDENQWQIKSEKSNPDLHLHPDPLQFADDKPKCMDYEPILSLFQGFEPLIRKLGSGSASKSASVWKVGSGSASTSTTLSLAHLMIGGLSDSDRDVGVHGRLHGGGQAPLLQLEQLQEGSRRHHPVSALRRADWDTSKYRVADPGPFFYPWIRDG